MSLQRPLVLLNLLLWWVGDFEPFKNKLMNNFIEKQLLSDLNNDLKKRGKDNWNAKIRESEYFETIKQLSPESIKKCTFIWLEDYLKIRHDSWNIEVMRIDFFAYLLQNLEGVEERDLISIVSKLYETDFKVESTWWNVNGFAWLTCLLSHFEKIINENGINENISSSLDYF